MKLHPKISIITPSLNQADYLEKTILSVINQKYPNYEHIIIDGGSTDGSVDIIKRYSDKLTWWISEPDSGQAAAINKGLRRATGEWVAWQNSDDIYYPGAFHDLALAADRFPKVGLIIGDIMLIDEHDRLLRDICYVSPSYNALRAEGMLIANQAAFWNRRIQDTLGLLDEALHYSFDFEWFLRLTSQTQSAHISRVWGALRLHGETKTSTQAHCFLQENCRILCGREMPDWQKKFYMLRRMAIMLSKGKLGYVVRGIFRRTLNSSRRSC